MSYSGIEHKLRVFISSKCGGKYTIARKSLQKLLEVTGLVETYVFENEPASSEDTQSAYLEYVDGSNLCIFLIDNSLQHVKIYGYRSSECETELQAI